MDTMARGFASSIGSNWNKAWIALFPVCVTISVAVLIGKPELGRTLAPFVIFIAITFLAAMFLSLPSRSRSNSARVLLGLQIVNVIVSIGVIVAIVLGLAYGLEFLRAVASFATIAVLFLFAVLGMMSFDILSAYNKSEKVRFFTDSYVAPWQRLLTLKVLVATKEIRDRNHQTAKQRLQDLIDFLETTNRTKYLRDVLTMPCLSYLQKRQSQYMLGRFLMRRCNLGSLSRIIDSLTALVPKIPLENGEELSDAVRKLVQPIMDLDKAEDDIKRILHVDGTVNATLFLSADGGPPPSLLQGWKSVPESELDLWSSTLTGMRGKSNIHQLKRTARSAILGGGMLFVLMEIVCVVLAAISLPMAFAAPTWFSIGSFVVIAGMAVVTTCMFVGFWIPSVKNYLAIDGLVKDRVIFTVSDLESASIDTIRMGLVLGQLQNEVSFLGEKISLSSFARLCAYAYIPERPVKRMELSVSFPTPNTIKANLEYFLHTDRADRTVSVPSWFTTGVHISDGQMEELSSQIVSQPGDGSADKVDDTARKDSLAWFYANSVRVQYFKQLEVASVGKLAAYSPVRAIKGFQEEYIPEQKNT